MQLLTFLGGSVVGTFIGYFIKYGLDLRMSKKIEEENNKREVYEDMIISLNVFVSGRSAPLDLKSKFLNSYSRLWLWAPDMVVKKVGIHLDDQIRVNSNKSTVTENELKKSYANAVIEMRKDIGHNETTLETNDYKFVSFN